MPRSLCLHRRKPISTLYIAYIFMVRSLYLHRRKPMFASFFPIVCFAQTQWRVRNHSFPCFLSPRMHLMEVLNLDIISNIYIINLHSYWRLCSRPQRIRHLLPSCWWQERRRAENSVVWSYLWSQWGWRPQYCLQSFVDSLQDDGCEAKWKGLGYVLQQTRNDVWHWPGYW